jgi:hypothetical protein
MDFLGCRIAGPEVGGSQTRIMAQSRVIVDDYFEFSKQTHLAFASSRECFSVFITDAKGERTWVIALGEGIF